MRTVKNDQKIINHLRKQLLSLQEKQKDVRKRLRTALQKAGHNAGRTVRHIHAKRLTKKK